MSVYDWNNKSLDTLGPVSPSESLHTSGDYAIWADEPILNMRNLRTAQNNVLSSSASVTSYNDIDSNGIVAFTATNPAQNTTYPSSNIYLFSNNATSPITNNTNYYNYGPVTDGVSVVYVKAESCCQQNIPGQQNTPVLTYSIHIIEGQTDSIISNVGMEPPFPGPDFPISYEINNGYIAWSKPDSSGHMQIWLMDNQRRTSQITFSGNFNSIERLNENGDLTFKNTIQDPVKGSISKRYFANRSTGQIQEVSSGNGHAYYRNSSWYLVLGRMLYKIDVTGSTYITPTPKPFLSGLNYSYCIYQDTQKIKILNLPDTTKGTIVTVQLDSLSLAIQTDSSFSFNPSALASGPHVVKVLYDYSSNNQQLFQWTFTVRDPVKPEVNLTSSTSRISDTSAPLVITAIDIAGGGSTPTYTFAKDRNFLHILQAESLIDTLSIISNSLDFGQNEIYVSMKTSDSCYVYQSALDSIQIVRDSTKKDSIPVIVSTPGGLVDPDIPGQTIVNYPNPASQYLTISGISDSKSYLFKFYDEQGGNTIQVQVSASKTANLDLSYLKPGKYWLSIYDTGKNKLIGTMAILKN
jgi:hypothetical protein